VKQYLWIFLVGAICLFSSITSAQTAGATAANTSAEKMVSLDFDNVDLPVLVKFISELTGKNFVIDEQVRGKVTIFSPVKIPTAKAYDVFLSVLEMKGFTVTQAGEVYQILPFASSPPIRAMHIYTLQNTLAEEMSQILTSLVSRAAAPMRPRSKPSDEITGTVQIITDKTTNRLIITASDDDYQIIEKTIKSLDMQRRQVYVEAIVMEMNEETRRDLGSDFGAIGGYAKAGSDVAFLGGFNQKLDQGFLSLFTGGTGAGAVDLPNIDLRPVNIQSLIRLLEESKGVNVLSTPQILTSDKQKAEISVAQNVPFPGATTNAAVGTQTTTVERKDVGIILRLTPTIMDSNQVKLDLYQEISSVLSTDEKLGPTTTKRAASTIIVVGDGQTAVIGGLLGDNVILSEKKIPLLGDIPILGYLFKFKTKKVEKTNLVIFVTPHIVPDGEGKNGFSPMLNSKVDQSLAFLKKSKLIEGKSGREVFLKGMINLPK
jgi:general secretion pathway protein D